MEGSNHIFISYRREDSADVTGRIHDRLSQHFGHEAIFTDVDSIPLGEDFKDYIDRQVGQCQILLAVIGKNWTQIKNEEGKPRLQVLHDYVRIEIESALIRNIPVIPLLVQGANMPSEAELPETLKKLIYRNGLPIRPNPDFHRDMDRLVKGLERQLAKRGEEKKKEEKENSDPTTNQEDSFDAKSIYERGLKKYEAKAYLEALGLFTEAAKAGNAEAAFQIGKLYEDGLGVDRHYAKAMEWFLKAADNGSNNGMNSVGRLHFHGYGVPQNHQNAFMWYQKAADDGNISAMRNLGLLYEHGKGVKQDYYSALKWYAKAANAGNADAMNGIGVLCYNGDGVPQNYQMAFKWYRTAADSGSHWAMYNLGLLYENGDGVKTDISKALEWYQKATNLGNEDAKKALERLDG